MHSYTHQQQQEQHQFSSPNTQFQYNMPDPGQGAHPFITPQMSPPAYPFNNSFQSNDSGIGSTGSFNSTPSLSTPGSNCENSPPWMNFGQYPSAPSTSSGPIRNQKTTPFRSASTTLPFLQYADAASGKWPRNMVFGDTQGRLSDENVTFKMTIGEMYRRTHAPEMLHVSIINGIMRKAKAKGNAKELRTILGECGVAVPNGRRKACQLTPWTSLCEEESVQVARDFGRFVGKMDHFGMAGEMDEQRQAEEPNPYVRRRKIINMLTFISSMESVYGTLEEMPEDIVIKSEADADRNRVSLYTHGFSHNADMVYLSLLRSIYTISLNAVNDEIATIENGHQFTPP